MLEATQDGPWTVLPSADFLDPEGRKDSGHAQVIFEGQIAIKRALIPGAAINTPVVAAIRDRDPQVGDGAAEFVSE